MPMQHNCLSHPSLCAQVIYDKPSFIQKKFRFVLSVTIVSMFMFFFWTVPPFASCEGALASASHEMLEHAGKHSYLSCHWIVEVVLSQVLSSSCFFSPSLSLQLWNKFFIFPLIVNISEPVCLLVGRRESHDYRIETNLNSDESGTCLLWKAKQMSRRRLCRWANAFT